VDASRDLLGELVARHGDVGEMVATMAHSPAVLGGYLALTRAPRRTKLDRGISELVSIAIQAQQGCGLCLHSHIEAARTRGVSEEDIALATNGNASTPAVAAIISLGLALYREPLAVVGW
jgi:AhpD family alkylhydroperoxidase